ncbi:MAG: hypothetical protein ACP5GZ_02250 [Vulcanisaeta sp.]|jgi:hypothetical protein|uniref:hypothetical protein n=1 Tax=Vulcanisaeta sp. TaxID=2020871 RepID=UPI003D128B4A
MRINDLRWILIIAAIGLGLLSVGLVLRLLNLITIGVFYGFALASLEAFLIFTALIIGTMIMRRYGINCKIANWLYGLSGFYVSGTLLASFTVLTFNLHVPQWVNTTIITALIVGLGLVPIWVLSMVLYEKCKKNRINYSGVNSGNITHI